MLLQLLSFLNSAAGQAAIVAGEGLFERGLAAIEKLIVHETAIPAAPVVEHPTLNISGSSSLGGTITLVANPLAEAPSK